METQTTQCDYCTFKITEDQSSYYKDRQIEAKYVALRATKNAPAFERKMTLNFGDVEKKNTTETCFLNSPLFTGNKENDYCLDRINDAIPLVEALALRESRISNSIASNAVGEARKAQVVAIVAIIIAIFPFIPQIAAIIF
jgi:hypothetical protein